MSEEFDLKNAAEDIISSHEMRIQSIGSIFDTTHLLLEEFQESFLDTKEEREKITTCLRDILARNESLRRKDFDNMMNGILSSQYEREREVRTLLKDYLNEQKEMAHALKENLVKIKDSLDRGEADRVKEFQALIREILDRQEKRKEEVTSMLKGFQKEQKDLAVRLRDLLSKGNALRIKDLKLMHRVFKTQREERLALHRKRREEVAKMLYDFKKERKTGVN